VLVESNFKIAKLLVSVYPGQRPETVLLGAAEDPVLQEE